MVTCTGKSLIPININAFQQFMNQVIPSAKLPEFTIKFDGRAKVKSVFAKLEEKELTIYTGAIVSLGVQSFNEIPDILSLLMLFTIYGVKKAGVGENFEIKSTAQGISDVKSDPVFQELAGKVHFFIEKFVPLNEQAIETPVQKQEIQKESFVKAPVENTVVEEAPKKKRSSSKDSPFKDVPLEDTPKIEVPADLDLRTA